MICESCRELITEEAGADLDEETLEVIAVSMGAELPDHNCEAVLEPPGECACACPGAKNRGRRAAAAPAVRQ